MRVIRYHLEANVNDLLVLKQALGFLDGTVALNAKHPGIANRSIR